MSTKYTYSVANDTANGIVNSAGLFAEIENTAIVSAIDYINTTNDDLDVYMMEALSAGDEVILDTTVSGHLGIFTVDDAPTTADGRPIVRSDSRPVGWFTMFTMAGDTASGIGDGQEVYWDFSNDDDVVDGVLDGYTTKRMKVEFIDPVYIKEGTNYFFNAPRRSRMSFHIVCPSGQYYLDNNGSPQLASEDTVVVNYLNKHFFSGSAAMGDELNTEGCSETPLPTNYYLRVEVSIPTVSGIEDVYGYGELELYRQRTVIL